jgi:hypothetical protein
MYFMRSEITRFLYRGTVCVLMVLLAGSRRGCGPDTTFSARPEPGRRPPRRKRCPPGAVAEL